MRCKSHLLTCGVGFSVLLVFIDLAFASHGDDFSNDGLVTVTEATDYPHLMLAAHPNVPIQRDQNVIWCSSLQLSWNEACNLVGGIMAFPKAAPVSLLVSDLNRQDYKKTDVDEASYIAIADFERNHVEAEIKVALENKFHGEASPKLVPEPPLSFDPDDFVAYAYLFKNLAFYHHFIKNDDPLVFRNTAVQSFGFFPSEKPSIDLLRQVYIVRYSNPDDFIIQLAPTTCLVDQLFLAKIPPGKTLQATIQTVLEAKKKPSPEPITFDDSLSVPLINFDITGHFKQLEGLELKANPSGVVRNLKIKSAIQNVRFQLNEAGAILKSEAVMVPSFSLPTSLPPPHHDLIFDKPFLIMMKQRKSLQPYFAMWVGDDTFLVKEPAKTDSNVPSK